jgi:NADH-quinone oxidoreductase subunit M
VSLTDALILLPLASAVVIWLAPLPREASAGLAFLAALGEVALWITTVARFDFGTGVLQFQTRFDWFEDLGVSYHVGLYGFSLWLVGLASVVSAAALGYAMVAGRERARAYGGLMLFLTGAVVGVFTAQDLLLFYVFFEAMMIPTYVLIGVWGGPGRLRATVTFVIYTMAGSLLMLASIVAYGISQGTFSLVDGGASSNDWVFLGFAIAFAIKSPLFPFHGWLVAAYRESPAELAAVLSGIVSKAAVYGFIRIAIAKFPEPADDFTVPILVLAAIGLVYGSMLAFRAPDLRGVLAYSSMAQMSLITFGLFAFNDLGLDGAILQAVNHGLISTSMFLLAGMVERRAATGDFALLGGMAKGRPALATLLMTTGVIALAVPGSSAFAGEFAILAGVFEQGWGYAAVGAGAIVLAAMYVLRLISAVLHRQRGSAVSDAALDLRPAELSIVVPLVALLLGLSIWPASVSARSFPGNSSAILAGVSQSNEGTTIFASVRVPYEGLETAHVSPTDALDDAPQSCKDDLDRKLRAAASIEPDGSFVTAITVCRTETSS